MVDFNGKDVSVGVRISFTEALHGTNKKIAYKREVRCTSFNGTKEAPGSMRSKCFSCLGAGIKKDPLFHKESKCNTCDGHGFMVKNPCM